MSTIVRDLWPPDLVAEDVLGPQDILECQAKLLTRRMNSLLQGQVVKTDTGDRIILGFEVNAPKIDVTKQLFTVQHQSDAEYPVLLVPPDDDIPGYLKGEANRTISPPAGGGAIEALRIVAEQLNPPSVGVEWVAASPEQFSNKLERILNSSTVKSAILSLLAKSQRSQASANPPESPE